MAAQMNAGQGAQSRLDWLVLLAPLVFICHFVEEAPGFVAWFNAHVSRGIDQSLFWRVNLVALVITVLVVGLDAPRGLR